MTHDLGALRRRGECQCMVTGTQHCRPQTCIEACPKEAATETSPMLLVLLPPLLGLFLEARTLISLASL